MKRNCIKCFILITCVILHVSCESSIPEDIISVQEPMQSYDSSIRLIDEAREEAEKAIGFLERGLDKTRATSGATTRRIEPKPICMWNTSSTRSSITDVPLYYVFNFENNEGYAIISADRSTPALLAVTEKGHFAQNDSSDISSFIRNSVANYLAIGGNLPPIRPLDTLKEFNETRTTYERIYENRVHTKWGANNPLGSYFGSSGAGCANVAILQAMSYFEYPTTINLTYSGLGNAYIDWSDIKGHVRGGAGCVMGGCAASDYAHELLGHLAKEVAHRTNSYTVNGLTATTNSGIKSGLESLGYTTSEWYYSNDTDLLALGSSNILIYSGTDPTKGNLGGHVWVVDGGQYYEHRDSFWVRRICDFEWTLQRATITHECYSHVNWGWDGDNNGLFYNNIFATCGWHHSKYDDGHDNRYYNFSYNEDVKFIVVRSNQ